jgi:hypothetical protein
MCIIGATLLEYSYLNCFFLLTAGKDWLLYHGRATRAAEIPASTPVPPKAAQTTLLPGCTPDQLAWATLLHGAIYRLKV